MLAYTPTGPLLSFVAAANSNAAANVAVQAVSLTNVGSQQVKLSNIDGTNDAVVGWGATAAQAALNAAAGATVVNCTYLMHSTVEVVTVPVNSFVTAILVGGTPTIKAQMGYGN